MTRPFGGPGEGDSVGAELFHAQVTRAQGIFSLRQVIRCWGLDYIAENLETPSTVLHYPSPQEFEAVLREKRFDWIGLNFVVATVHKLRPMVETIRRLQPRARIVLGGYGTVLPDTMLRPLSDAICREEGIAFMRRLLGEDPHRPIRHPFAPVPSPKTYGFSRKGIIAHVTGGLGCRHGCDFCCTSHFFRRRYLPFVDSGDELFEIMVGMEDEARRQGLPLNGFAFIDEDFFANEDRARAFLARVRREGKVFRILGFGSVASLSLYEADEIAAMGFDLVWTAFEASETGYAKLRGRPVDALHAALRRRGVSLLTSMIIGFPHQDEARIRSDFEAVLALEPAMSQILIYFAIPGTPFWERAKREDLHLPRYAEAPDWRRWDGFSMHMRHPGLSAERVEAIQRELYAEEFRRLGPSIQRFLSIGLEGHLRLRASADPLLRARAEDRRRYLVESLPALYPAIFFGPTRRSRRAALDLLHRIHRHVAPTSLFELAGGLLLLVLSAWTALAMRLNLFQQPRLHREDHARPRKRVSSNPETATARRGDPAPPLFPPAPGAAPSR